MAVVFRGFVYDDTGVPISNVDVYAYAGVTNSALGAAVGHVTTDSYGMWVFNNTDISGYSASTTYDFAAVNGSQVRRVKGYTIPPQSITNSSIATAADIALTKLNYGVADESQNPATLTVTNLDDRVTQIASQFKKVTGGTHWYDAPDTTLLKAVRMANGASSTKLWVSSTSLNTNAGLTVDSGSFVHGGTFTGTPTAVFYNVEGAPAGCLPATVATVTLTSTNLRFTVTWNAVDGSSPHAFSVNYFIVGV